jgi:hypothetical protein
MGRENNDRFADTKTHTMTSGVNDLIMTDRGSLTQIVANK